MPVRVWIDTTSGTWGTNVERVVTVDLEKQAERDNDPNEDAHSLLAFLEDATDSEICAFGIKYGRKIL